MVQVRYPKAHTRFWGVSLEKQRRRCRLCRPTRSLAIQEEKYCVWGISFGRGLTI